MFENIQLEKRAATAGAMDMIIATIEIVISYLDIRELSEGDGLEEDAAARQRSRIVLYIAIGISVMKFIMGSILWKGAKIRDDKRCLQWLYVSFMLWCVQIIIFVTKLVFGTFVISSTIWGSISILIRVIVMYIVYRFIQEIREEKRIGQRFPIA